MATRRAEVTLARGARACLVAGSLMASSCGKSAHSASDSGGAAGEVGDVGGASPCVDVSHVSARQAQALRTIGSGFEAYEGQMIRIVATVGEPYYGLGEAPIGGGSFDILLPGVLSDYTELGVYVDTIRDDACDPGDEILWQRATGPASAWGPGLVEGPAGVVVWEITPDDLTVFEQAGPCNINGNFDVTNPLRCPAQ